MLTLTSVEERGDPVFLVPKLMVKFDMYTYFIIKNLTYASTAQKVLDHTIAACGRLLGHTLNKLVRASKLPFTIFIALNLST
jgi:hypothetical protein